jgi:hypothetical protein
LVTLGLERNEAVPFGWPDKKLLRREMVLLRELKGISAESQGGFGLERGRTYWPHKPSPTFKSLLNPGLHSARLKLVSLAQR